MKKQVNIDDLTAINELQQGMILLRNRKQMFDKLSKKTKLLENFNSPVLKAAVPPTNAPITSKKRLRDIPPVLKGTRPPKAFS